MSWQTDPDAYDGGTEPGPSPMLALARRELLARDRDPERWRPTREYREPLLSEDERAELDSEFAAEHEGDDCE